MGELMLNNFIRFALMALVVVAIVYAIGGSVLYAGENSKINKAISQIEKMKEIMDGVFDEGITKRIEIFPTSGWYLRSWPLAFPFGECKGSEGCLCMCDKKLCDGVLKCQGFDYYVELDSEFYNYDEAGDGLRIEEFYDYASGEERSIGHVLKLSEPVYQFDIIKEGDMIIIREVK
ncbi:hypothetical protein CMI42_06010 [Candidatus Pacearchaeota archaeon]|nr:hypothetical protein [Candidatus Pacearchaeota archaeon]|tara:strand:+ start:235 stop:762 length:528 start_codon:yes stop_codon:yes gene_type:complete